MSDINPGDMARVTTNPPFSIAGSPADPTAVSLIWRKRGGPPTTWVYGVDAEVVKDGTGVYHADIPVPSAGTFYFRWVGTGAVAAAEENSFVSTTKFG